MFLPLIAALTLLTGCANDCQQICNEMADWAESECDSKYHFSDEQLTSCLAAYDNGNVSDAQLADCSDSMDSIDEQWEWECEDIHTYFDE